MSGPESPTPTYVGVRVGRDVRVARHQGADVIGRLAAFDGADLTIEGRWMGQDATTTVPFEAVSALWVRG